MKVLFEWFLAQEWYRFPVRIRKRHLSFYDTESLSVVLLCRLFFFFFKL